MARYILIVSLLISLGMPAYGIVYQINPMTIDSDTAITGGFFETDGTIGPLVESNLVSWSVNVSSSISYTFDSSSPDNGYDLVGDIVATATDLIVLPAIGESFANNYIELEFRPAGTSIGVFLGWESFFQSSSSTDVRTLSYSYVDDDTGDWDAQLLSLPQGEFVVASVDPSSAFVLVGEDIPISVGEGSGTPGGLDAVFDDVTGGGSFTSEYIQVPQNDLDDLLGGINSGAANFAIGYDPVQLWDINFDGEFSGPVEVTFGYDDTNLTLQQEQNISIWHFEDNEWVSLPKIGIDTTANTVTVITTSFSPFVLSAVPEPSTSVLALAALCMVFGRSLTCT